MVSHEALIDEWVRQIYREKILSRQWTKENNITILCESLRQNEYGTFDISFDENEWFDRRSTVGASLLSIRSILSQKNDPLI